MDADGFGHSIGVEHALRLPEEVEGQHVFGDPCEVPDGSPSLLLHLIEKITRHNALIPKSGCERPDAFCGMFGKEEGLVLGGVPLEEGEADRVHRVGWDWGLVPSSNHPNEGLRQGSKEASSEVIITIGEVVAWVPCNHLAQYVPA